MAMKPPLSPVDQVREPQPLLAGALKQAAAKMAEDIKAKLWADRPSVAEPSHVVDWTGAPTKDCKCLQCVEWRAAHPAKPLPWPRIWHYGWRAAAVVGFCVWQAEYLEGLAWRLWGMV